MRVVAANRSLQRHVVVELDPARVALAAHEFDVEILDSIPVSVRGTISRVQVCPPRTYVVRVGPCLIRVQVVVIWYSERPIFLPC